SYVNHMRVSANADTSSDDLSLHDALPISMAQANDALAKVKSSGHLTLGVRESSGALGYTLGDGKYVGFHTEMAENITADIAKLVDRKSTRLNSSHVKISYAVFC